MSSGVKWIKITTDLFDDEKIAMIESLPAADTIIVIWFKLLTFAGKQNNDGVFLMNDRIAYTDEMLATIFRRDISVVRIALSTFENFGMIEIIDGVVTIPNWNKHQSLDAYERKKERDRLYQQERRTRQRMLIEKSSDSNAIESCDIVVSDIEEEREEEEKTYTVEKQKKVPEHCQFCQFVNVCDKSINEHFEYVWKYYPEKSGKSGVKDSTKKELYKYSYSQLENAIEKYKAYVKTRSNDRFQMPYKNGDTFFRTYYKDYLEESHNDEKTISNEVYRDSAGNVHGKGARQ